MSAQIIMKPDAVLGLATGSTPVGMYAQLVEWYKKGDLDFSRVTSVNLDEYKGLSGDNDQSYRYFMDHNLFDHVNIDKARTFVPDGLEEDSDKACAQYNEIIRQTGGVDMQLLGIGGNGHIGFNEPGDAFEKETAEYAGVKGGLVSKEIVQVNGLNSLLSMIKAGYGVSFAPHFIENYLPDDVAMVQQNIYTRAKYIALVPKNNQNPVTKSFMEILTENPSLWQQFDVTDRWPELLKKRGRPRKIKVPSNL